MHLIDTHTHLTEKDLVSQLDTVLEKAKSAGVQQFVVPGIDGASSRQAITLAEKYPEILPAIGLHPSSEAEPLESFEALVSLPLVKAVGEIGTDASAGDFAAQEARLRFFLELAIKHNKPALIHIRDTWSETFRILRDYPELKGKAVIHCFTGGPAEAEEIAKLGLFLSVTAIVARPALADTRTVLAAWPLEQMMLETDSPWLAWPGEKWPNDPATVARIAEFSAELRGVDKDVIAEETTRTAQKFFGL